MRLLRRKSPAHSFRHALNGLLMAFKAQQHVRYHFFLGVLVLLAGVVWRLSTLQFCLLVLAISLVILTELLNTAVETTIDLVTTDYHPLARVAKDVAAGAVLVAATNALLIGALIFLDLPALWARLRPPEHQAQPVETGVIGLVVIFLVLVIWKVKGGKGRFLHGGVVSGHSAIAFFLSTLIILLSLNPLVSLTGLVLALLVAQSRVEAGVHTLREVVFGALLGILVPVALHRLLPYVAVWVTGFGR